LAIEIRACPRNQIHKNCQYQLKKVAAAQASLLSCHFHKSPCCIMHKDSQEKSQFKIHSCHHTLAFLWKTTLTAAALSQRQMPQAD